MMLKRTLAAAAVTVTMLAHAQQGPMSPDAYALKALACVQEEGAAQIRGVNPSKARLSAIEPGVWNRIKAICFDGPIGQAETRALFSHPAFQKGGSEAAAHFTLGVITATRAVLLGDLAARYRRAGRAVD